MKRECRFYSIRDVFDFGKYLGLTLADILDFDPSYFVWCIAKCTGIHILIENETINEIKKAYPELCMNDFFEQKCRERFIIYENDCDECEYGENYPNDEYNNDIDAM